MDARRRRRGWAFLLVLPAMLLVCGPARADADFVSFPGDFEPAARPVAEEASAPIFSVVAVLLNHTILGFVVPLQSINETVNPAPAPTIVIPAPPTMPQLVALSFHDPLPVNYLTVPVMQTYTVWTPTSTSVEVANISRVPEPGSLLSGLLGLGGLLWFRRRSPAAPAAG